MSFWGNGILHHGSFEEMDAEQLEAKYHFTTMKAFVDAAEPPFKRRSHDRKKQKNKNNSHFGITENKTNFLVTSGKALSQSISVRSLICCARLLWQLGCALRIANV